MKKLLLIIALALTTGLAYGQNPFPKGRTQLNIGIGLSDWGVPIYFGIDRGVGSDFSLGGELSFRTHRHRSTGSHSITGIAGNANYHFNRILEINDDWDFYAGVNLGFYIWPSNDEYDEFHGNQSSDLGLGAQIGARYYFTEKVGINLEFGSGNAFSGGKVGVTIKI